MTALARLFRTTTFKLTLVYLTLFAAFASILLGYFAFNTRRIITEQITRIVDTEINGLIEQHEQGGIRRLVRTIEDRSRQPGSSLFLLTTFSGEGLAGNVDGLPPGTINQSGWTETAYRRIGESDDEEHRALARILVLTGGFRLLVGRDLEERDRLRNIILEAGQWSLALVLILGLGGGFLVTRRVLRRVDAMTATTRTIMAGNLSGRLPLSGSGDEFDRLAGSLNEMLERIEALMLGLKEVSDNIAHDLKTPLTRLRNQGEAALRNAYSVEDFKAALGSIIEESEDLIRTFNALLLIARAESGQSRDDMIVFDAAAIARDVGELYEPLADERGLRLHVDAPQPVFVKGNRELISQALVNLVDNAIKYGHTENAKSDKAKDVRVQALQHDNRVLLCVTDHGAGIPEQERGRVVERFVRLEQSRAEPGSGLGLSLAAAVARLHGGELRLEDNAPGLRAIIALPHAIDASA